MKICNLKIDNTTDSTERFYSFLLELKSVCADLSYHRAGIGQVYIRLRTTTSNPVGAAQKSPEDVFNQWGPAGIRILSTLTHKPRVGYVGCWIRVDKEWAIALGAQRADVNDDSVIPDLNKLNRL